MLRLRYRDFSPEPLAKIQRINGKRIFRATKNSKNSVSRSKRAMFAEEMLLVEVGYLPKIER